MSAQAKLLLTILPFGILISGLGGIYYWIKEPDRFPVCALVIKDEIRHVSSIEIQDALSKELNRGFFWMNVRNMQDKLAQIGWVASVSVKRNWPDKLDISIKEKTALAQWGEKGVVSTDGDLFFPYYKSIPTGLPLFIGPETQVSDMLQQYLSALEQLSPLGLKVSEVKFDLNDGWKIRLDNGIAIILGKLGQDNRLARFAYAYKAGIAPHFQRIAYVDLRYSNGLAIGWKSSTE